MRIDVLTLFPGMFRDFLGESMIKRAQDREKVDIRIHNIRDYAADKHRKADDKPFGGGPGMVLTVEPIYNALKKIMGTKQSTVHGSTSSPPLECIRLRSAFVLSRSKGELSRAKSRGSSQSTVILMSPQGRKFEQEAAKKLAKLDRLVLICGHYEGVDERVRKNLVDAEISIGDYILTCGELPAMVVIDAVTRLVPGVLGDKDSLNRESFENGLLEYPQYTRPALFRGWNVPAVLLSGDHKKVEAWRMREALRRTKKKRPDLLRCK